MKKTIILLLSVVLMNTQAKAQMCKPITFSTEIVPHGTIGMGHPKSPIDPPTVYLEDYTLAFEADHPEYILYIKDEDDAVVYSTVVSTTVTEVVLPSYLSGDYEIDLVMGDWLFMGYLML